VARWRSHVGNGEDWRRWSELDGCSHPSEERRGCRWERVVEVVAGVLHPFVGSGRRGGGRLGSDGGGGALSKWWPVMEWEAKRRCRLMEGKGGGGRVTSGLVWRRWPEAHDTTRHGRPSDGTRASGAGGMR
jgi:hypothetical protein